VRPDALRAARGIEAIWDFDASGGNRWLATRPYSRDNNSASAVGVWATNRREIADLLVLVAAAATVTPTDSSIRNCRREATPART
jgi:hypothetical protein